MKTKELIALLQKLDPSGEVEVVADNTPIYFAERLPAYYDGALQMLGQDSAKTGYNIVGYKATCNGEKIQLHLMGLSSVISEDQNVVIDTSELSEGERLWFDRAVKQIKEGMAQEESDECDPASEQEI